MNFLAHLAVATWYSPLPATWLGAMIPDFAGMLGARAPQSSDRAVSRGIALHHQTDGVFHAAPIFHTLNREALAELTRLGMARGPARAVAHIGTEIILDGVIAEDHAFTRAFSQALEHGHQNEQRLKLEWPSELPFGRLGKLCDALQRRDIRADSQQADIVALRLERTLGHRPRLKIPSHQLPLVSAWAQRSTPVVRAQAPALLNSVRAGLAALGHV